MPPKKVQTTNKDTAPLTLDNNPFFGLKLDEQQKEFRDAIWSQDNDIVFCDAKAGSGKTLLAVATAKLLVDYGRCDELIYITAPTQEQKLGFMPGNIVEKEKLYYTPIFDALVQIGEQPQKAIKQLGDEKTTNGWINCISHVFLRGTNLKNKKIIIVDEAQNYYLEELKKTLTRISSDCKVVVIGHKLQIDLYKNPQNSGFIKYLEHFKDKERCKVCELTINYRGWISQHADDLVI